MEKGKDSVVAKFKGTLKYDYNQLMQIIMMKKILEHYEKIMDLNKDLKNELEAKTKEL